MRSGFLGGGGFLVGNDKRPGDGPRGERLSWEHPHDIMAKITEKDIKDREVQMQISEQKRRNTAHRLPVNLTSSSSDDVDRPSASTAQTSRRGGRRSRPSNIQGGSQAEPADSSGGAESDSTVCAGTPEVDRLEAFGSQGSGIEGAAPTEKQQSETKLFKEANKLYAEKDRKAALQCCQKADEESPGNIFLLTNLVASASTLGEYGLADSKGMEAEALVEEQDLLEKGDASTQACVMALYWWTNLVKWSLGQNEEALARLVKAAVQSHKLQRHDRFIAILKRHRDLRLAHQRSKCVHQSESDSKPESGLGKENLGLLLLAFETGSINMGRDDLVEQVMLSNLEAIEKQRMVVKVDAIIRMRQPSSK